MCTQPTTLLIDYFTNLQSKATTDDGFWRLPNGEEAYASSLAFFTTTDYTPQYIHDLGLREVEPYSNRNNDNSCESKTMTYRKALVPR